MIDMAIEFAVKAHYNQVRKGSDIPYITHPLAVGIILAKAGCSDGVIMAGILHDTVEDTSVTLDDLRDTFGEKVSMIVKGASELDKSLKWEERKSHTHDFLKGASQEVKFVALADKLHNIRTIASDYAKIGEALWERFNRGRDAQQWYYQGLVQALHDDSAGKTYQILHKEFSREVDRVFENKKQG
ncbi:MAG: bifunctional (p)ppGpp synthetase/guanosine-3',5'-bis(diphosphate) 3'-pyrophosphohydrolase [Deltaproteobacteria bacterium]|nr:bifunctional (p)ppGpp synthetase/guanosine-3',5'-bis(diphosphate) 3'-pyrophosphohydrolase [Deltaproteobacteria bacterium]